MLKSILHHYPSLNSIFSGGGTIVCEEISQASTWWQPTFTSHTIAARPKLICVSKESSRRHIFFEK